MNVSFNKTSTLSQAKSAGDNGTIYFPIDSEKIVVAGKEYGGEGSSSSITALNIKSEAQVGEEVEHMAPTTYNTYVISNPNDMTDTTSGETIYVESEYCNDLFFNNGSLKVLRSNGEAYYKIAGTWYSQNIKSMVNFPTYDLFTTKVGAQCVLRKVRHTADEFFSKYIDFASISISDTAFQAYKFTRGYSGKSDGEFIKFLIVNGEIYSAAGDPNDGTYTAMPLIIKEGNQSYVDIGVADIETNVDDFHTGDFWPGNCTKSGVYSIMTSGRPEGSDANENYMLFVDKDGSQSCMSIKNPTKWFRRNKPSDTWIKVDFGGSYPTRDVATIGQLNDMIETGVYAYEWILSIPQNSNIPVGRYDVFVDRSSTPDGNGFYAIQQKIVNRDSGCGYLRTMFIRPSDGSVSTNPIIELGDKQIEFNNIQNFIQKHEDDNHIKQLVSDGHGHSYCEIKEGMQQVVYNDPSAVCGFVVFVPSGSTGVSHVEYLFMTDYGSSVTYETKNADRDYSVKCVGFNNMPTVTVDSHIDNIRQICIYTLPIDINQLYIKKSIAQAVIDHESKITNDLVDKEELGNINDLTTFHKDTIVDAINEINELTQSNNDQIYGVRHHYNNSTPVLERIGNMTLHRTLPIQNAMKRCILNDNGDVVYYLDSNNSNLKEDGSDANLDGTDGQVMVEIPTHYRRFTLDEEAGTYDCEMSLYPFKDAHVVNKHYISAYEATLNRINSKLASVDSNDTTYRGGNNASSYDDTYRTLLNKPVTATSLTSFRSYANNRGSNWKCLEYDAYCSLYWLYVVEYANLNCQLTFTTSLTEEGYKTGGLGVGVTDFNSDIWNSQFGYYPIVPCGVTNSLGNNTGYVPYDVLYAEGSQTYTAKVPSYRGIENPFGHIWKWVDGFLAKGNGTNQEYYICHDRSNYSSTVNTSYNSVGMSPGANGYKKSILRDENGSILTSETGGGSTTYFSDYHYEAFTNGTIYGLLVGGSAHDGSRAGLAYCSSCHGPGYTYAYIGSRLCYSDYDRIIN